MTEPSYAFHSTGAPPVVNLRCPHCGQNGAFHGPQPPGHHPVPDVAFALTTKDGVGKLLSATQEFYGVRVCPNTKCAKPVFVRRHGSGVMTCFPPERLDFDGSNIPDRIRKSFEEAIGCYSIECFKASAIMVRRTLEEVCEDQMATGGNLKERIAALGTKIVVPTTLMRAADELRLLGNDAAHLESKDYDDVGRDELDVAIELAKEILKAVYQYEGLLARLQRLKKPAAAAAPSV